MGLFMENKKYDQEVLFSVNKPRAYAQKTPVPVINTFFTLQYRTRRVYNSGCGIGVVILEWGKVPSDPCIQVACLCMVYKDLLPGMYWECLKEP